MDKLPNERLQVGPPFITTGVESASPFQIKDRKERGCKIMKGCICLFICFISKAIHLELVLNLAKDSFITVLRRFVSRRGKPTKIWSNKPTKIWFNNGTNFLSARNELQE